MGVKKRKSKKSKKTVTDVAVADTAEQSVGMSAAIKVADETEIEVESSLGNETFTLTHGTLTAAEKKIVGATNVGKCWWGMKGNVLKIFGRDKVEVKEAAARASRVMARLHKDGAIKKYLKVEQHVVNDDIPIV